MDAIASILAAAANVVSVRTAAGDAAAMARKHRKSPALAAVIEHWSKPSRLRKSFLRALEEATDYPHNCRAAVFCWLWVNHAELSEVLWRWQPTWASVARIMEADGVRDRYGKAPTGNAVRRVWKRVCREIEAEQAKEVPR
ncbi:MAG: hypothetical protein JO157_02590 [Acetobacteraceae bacterium]|nr:hypothetical protein [Acetobacteraceae bacterium]